jgi:hypothetical protein
MKKPQKYIWFAFSVFVCFNTGGENMTIYICESCEKFFDGRNWLYLESSDEEKYCSDKCRENN